MSVEKMGSKSATVAGMMGSKILLIIVYETKLPIPSIILIKRKTLNC